MSPGSKGRPRRCVSRVAVRRELLVFVEGIRTEEIYLVYWHRRFRDRVSVTIDPYRGAPLQLVEHAVAAKQAEARDARRGRGRAHDQIWCVFDRDEHPNVPQAIDVGARQGINAALSNPCLELWFLLHFQDQTAYLERKVAQARAQALLGCSKVLSPAALEPSRSASTTPWRVPASSTTSTPATALPRVATRAATYGRSSTRPAKPDPRLPSAPRHKRLTPVAADRRGPVHAAAAVELCCRLNRGTSRRPPEGPGPVPWRFGARPGRSHGSAA